MSFIEDFSSFDSNAARAARAQEQREADLRALIGETEAEEETVEEEVIIEDEIPEEVIIDEDEEEVTIEDEEDEDDEEDEEEEEVEDPIVTAARIRAESLASDRLARAETAKRLAAQNAALATGNARDTLNDLFRQMFGNDPKFAPDIKLLTNQLEKLMIKGASSLEITQEIRQSDSYDKRFPGMDLRAAAGMSAISEAEYITLEDNYRNTMRMSGLSESFIDDDALYANLIAADVSAAELQTRVALAETAANGADPMILAQIEEFYPEMLEGNRLVEYYLDPDKAVNIFEEERRQRAAGLSVATLRTVGQGLDVGMAEALERENIQTREIQSRLGQRRGLTDQLLGEEAALTASEIASGEFGLEAEQATKLRRRREERVAGFSGQSGALTTNSGIKGLGTAT